MKRKKSENPTPNKSVPENEANVVKNPKIVRKAMNRKTKILIIMGIFVIIASFIGGFKSYKEKSDEKKYVYENVSYSQALEILDISGNNAIDKVQLNSASNIVTLTEETTATIYNASVPSMEAFLSDYEQSEASKNAEFLISHAIDESSSAFSVLMVVLVSLLIVFVLSLIRKVYVETKYIKTETMAMEEMQEEVEEMRGMMESEEDSGKKKDIEPVDTSKYSFKDVAGIDEELAEVKEVMDMIKNPYKYRLTGAKIPKGILFSGEPGTGKTLIAKAIAGEAGVKFYACSGSSFDEMYVGVGASRVRKLFEEARKNAPAIIFIDEIDAVAKKRFMEHSHNEQTLNQLLAEMDGFNEDDNIILIAATNHLEILDSAITRPGRFDRIINIPLPDRKGREEILKVHARNKLFMSEEEKERIIKTLARKTSGMSGATLENILNEAAIICASKSVLDIGFTPVSEEADENGNPIVKEGEFVELSKCELTEEFKQMLNETFENSEELRKYAREDGFCVITEENIDEAFIKVILGISKHDKETPYKVKELTAYHEAGHAIIGRIKTPEKKVLQVSIVPRGSAGGYTLFEDAEEMHYTTKEDFYNEILVDFGGRAAEHYKYSTISVGASADLNSANKMAHSMIYNYAMGNESQLVRIYGENDYNTQLESKMFAFMEDILSKAYKEAYDLLVANSALLDELSQALIEKSTLNSEEVEDIFKKYLS